MKKFIALLLSFVFLFLVSCVPATVEPPEGTEENTEITTEITTEAPIKQYEPDEDSALGVMFSNLTDKDLKIIYNTDRYSKNLRKETVEGTPVIKVYKGIPWDIDEFDFVYVRDLYKGVYEDYYYVLFSNPILQLTPEEFDGETKLCITRSFDSKRPPIFLRDLQSMKKTVSLMGRSAGIYDILCFCDDDYSEALIYFKTTTGSYVKYYYDYFSQGVEFRESKFAGYAHGYYNYLLNYDYNDLGYVGYISFMEYLDVYYPATVESYPYFGNIDYNR